MKEPHIIGYIFAIALGLCSIAGVLIGVIYSGLKSRIESLEHKDEDKERRLVIIETEKKHEMEALKKDIDEVKAELKSLKEYVHDYIHRERNTQQTILGLLKELNGNMEVQNRRG